MASNIRRLRSAASLDVYQVSVDPGAPVNFPRDINIGLLGAGPNAGKSELINLLHEVDVDAGRLDQTNDGSVKVRNEDESPSNSLSTSDENVSKTDSSEKPIKLNDSASEASTPDVNTTDAATQKAKHVKVPVSCHSSGQRDTLRYQLGEKPIYLCEIPEITEYHDPKAMARRSGLLAYDAVVVVIPHYTQPSNVTATMIKQVKEAGIPLYFVCTKTDVAMRNEQRRKEPGTYQDHTAKLKKHLKQLFQDYTGLNIWNDKIFMSGYLFEDRKFDLKELKQLFGNVQKIIRDE
ncbi:hypothetical protein [Endozoicomonas sp. ONNA2]|uniref:hypothetical protein n=1 Tax=Endozoicomonas sp. ONNA2 TaxID=2828741 RepID=UPI002148ED6B|nr:hypothetical protein [Endozoicomonas sp. ONNA2]